jgi:hypothetical protein
MKIRREFHPTNENKIEADEIKDFCFFGISVIRK